MNTLYVINHSTSAEKQLNICLQHSVNDSPDDQHGAHCYNSNPSFLCVGCHFFISLAIDNLALDGIHLKQCVTLYLFALPFVLVEDLHWKMIPIVTVVAFTLMGIEGIANQIEMPFGK